MRLRLMLAFALVILVTIGSVFYFARQGAENEIRNYLSRGGYAGLEGLVADLELYYAQNGSWSGVEVVVSGFHSGAGQGRNANKDSIGRGAWSNIRLADANGVIVYDSSDPQARGTIPANVLSAGIPLNVNGTLAGYLLPGVDAALPGDNFEQELMERLNLATRNAAIIASATALVLAVLLAYFLYRPLGKIASVAAKLGSGDLGQRVEIGGAKEMVSLGETFNRMADSLELAEHNRRAMTADIAHELRTPLAVQRASLEAMQDGVYPLNQENIDRVLEQNHLLSRIVEDLRTITLADAGELVLDKEPTDLGQLIRDTIADIQPQADRINISINARLDETVPPLAVDPLRIRQILHNLFQNALRYTPAGETLLISLAREGEHAVISLQDRGPGIPEEVIDRIFERFYRVDGSRSRELGGSGLGLAIARNLAQAHGGTLTVANHPEGGAVFTLTIPLIPFS